MMNNTTLTFPNRLVSDKVLRVRTDLKAGNCYEDCNDDLGVCLSKPVGDDPFALGINCQAEYDTCVNSCMAE